MAWTSPRWRPTVCRGYCIQYQSSSGQVRYLNFCNKFSINPLPLTDRSLCLFAAFLANEGLRAQSISVYLSAVRHLQIAAGFQAPPLASIRAKGYQTLSDPLRENSTSINSHAAHATLVGRADLRRCIPSTSTVGHCLQSHFLGFAGLENFFKLPPQYLLPL